MNLAVFQWLQLFQSFIKAARAIVILSASKSIRFWFR